MADVDYDYRDETSIDESLKCSICHDLFNDPYSTACKHIYCLACINNWLQSNNTCPGCRRVIKREDLRRAEDICNAMNRLVVTCRRCNENVRRDQFQEHRRNDCHRIRRPVLSPIDTNIRRPILNPERVELLLNQPLRQCQHLSEELERQRTTINNNNNHANNNINALHKKLKEQGDEIGILRQLNDTQQEKMQELQRAVAMHEEKFVDELTDHNRRLQNSMERFRDESERRIRYLENRVNELLPYNNDDLDDYITEKCEFGSQFGLRNSKLTDRDMKIIIRRVVINRQCSGLNLRKNRITSKGALLIANVLHRDIRLTILDLSYNKLSNNGVQYLAEALLANTALKELNLGSNEITNQGIKYLTEMLRLNETLKKLYLFENGFDDDGLKLLMNVLLKDNRTLTELSVRTNEMITDTSLYPIIDMLNENRTIDRIEIDQCGFSNGTKTRIRDAAGKASVTIDI